jgi:AcrR family transcriptional regulator
VTRKPRMDAEHNRRHLVAVARAAFATDGLELPMREIARRAGLGVATLYRHFPSRPDLVGAVLVEEVAVCGAEMRAALDDPDPWSALCETIRRFSERQVRDRGLNARGLEQLVERARSTGVLRPDVSVEDVRVGLLAISSFRALPPERANAAVRRLTNLLLAGLSRREPETGLPVLTSPS